MCKLLEIPRSLVYYHINKLKNLRETNQDEEFQLTEKIKELFRKSRNNYGSRKIKEELRKEGITISRRKIGKIMRANGLVSNYTVAQYKVKKTSSNEKEVSNLLERDFNNREKLEAIVSDLTYVRVDLYWHYICLVIDLSNREIIGYSAGSRKNAELIKEAIYSIKYPLTKVKIFHTDRGKEYDNKEVDEILDTFDIQRSLSEKGSPYDNAVSEATNKILKTEFVYTEKFESLEELKLKLAEYVYWYNNTRIHSSLGYKTPVEYKMKEEVYR